MNYHIKSLHEHYDNDQKPKRILTLDGGGLKGIVSIAMLERVEAILRERHGGDEGFRLCHYFDLIAGTSTGSIIAAALAQGWTVAEIRQTYFDLGKSVFEKSLLRKGFVRAKYSEAKLIHALKDAYGESTRLDDESLQTGLLIITKRMDTGSPWPISNNPGGKYFADQEDGSIGNGKYPLWQVVRASTAAPTFFNPQHVEIIKRSDGHTVQGEFVDGGVSPFNNPSLQALMFATLDGYRVNWPTGADKLLLVSIGTGNADPSVKASSFSALQGIAALTSLMDDSATLQEIMLQWLSSSPTAREFDSEMGNLQHDLLNGEPALTYLRYNLDLSAESVLKLQPDFDKDCIEDLNVMDAPGNMQTLYSLATQAAQEQVSEQHLPHGFDLS